MESLLGLRLFSLERGADYEPQGFDSAKLAPSTLTGSLFRHGPQQSPFAVPVQCGYRRRSQGNILVRIKFFPSRDEVFLVDKARIKVARHESRMAQNPLVKGDIGLDASHLVFP